MNKTKYIVIIGFILCLIACKTTKYVEVPIKENHTEYITLIKLDSIIKYDSIFVHDSIYIKEKGDTVFYYKWQTKYLTNTEFKYINRTDTIIKIDSIDKPVYITKEKEVNKIYWWLKYLMYIGGVVLLLLISYFGFKIFKLIKK